MNEPAFLVVWLAGLFALIGVVLGGVVRLVRRDTTEYDRKFVWQKFKRDNREDSDP